MKKKFGLLCTIALLGATFLQTAHANPNEAAFKKLDKDNNGYITKAEASASASLEEAFDDGDEDGDSKLSLAEFSALELTDE